MLNSLVTCLVVAATFLLPELGNAQSNIWKDPATGLTWTAQDNGARIDWQSSGQYCAKLNTANLSWRLPNIDELSKLSDPSQNSQCGITGTPPAAQCHIKQGITLSGWQAWSSTTVNDPKYPHSAWLFNFNQSKRFFLPYLNYYGLRALCVAN
jgi:hypothetical protein